MKRCPALHWKLKFHFVWYLNEFLKAELSYLLFISSTFFSNPFQVRENQHVGKSGESNFEDGTVSFLSITSLKFGFEVINGLGIDRISQHTFQLANYFQQSLRNLKYSNGRAIAEIYSSSSSFDDSSHQGGIVNFNLVKPDGSLFGFSEFQKIALHNNLVVRVGCFCNIGACQKYLVRIIFIVC